MSSSTESAPPSRSRQRSQWLRRQLSRWQSPLRFRKLSPQQTSPQSPQQTPQRPGWRRRWLVVLVITLVLLAAVWSPIRYEAAWEAAGRHLQPWLNNSLVIARGVLVSVASIQVVGWLIYFLERLVAKAHTFWRVLAGIVGTLAVVFTLLIQLFIVLAVSFSSLSGDQLQRDGQTYFWETDYPGSYVCWRLTGNYLMERTDPEKCEPDSSRQAAAEDPSSPSPTDTSSLLPDPASSSPLEPDTAPSPDLCDQDPTNCFVSGWNGALIHRSEAQRWLEAVAEDVEPIPGSPYGWAVMDAASGSRLVYLAEQDEDGWRFVTEMPPARGLGEFRYSAGRIYVDTEAGVYEFNPNTAAWVMPQ